MPTWRVAGAPGWEARRPIGATTRLAEARDEVSSGAADRKMLRTVESEEESPPDAWFWQNVTPEAFPQ